MQDRDTVTVTLQVSAVTAGEIARLLARRGSELQATLDTPTDAEWKVITELWEESGRISQTIADMKHGRVTL